MAAIVPLDGGPRRVQVREGHCTFRVSPYPHNAFEKERAAIGGRFGHVCRGTLQLLFVSLHFA